MNSLNTAALLTGCKRPLPVATNAPSSIRSSMSPALPAALSPYFSWNGLV